MRDSYRTRSIRPRTRVLFGILAGLALLLLLRSPSPLGWGVGGLALASLVLVVMGSAIVLLLAPADAGRPERGNAPR